MPTLTIDSIKKIAAKPAPTNGLEVLEQGTEGNDQFDRFVEESLDYLSSCEALASIEIDAYWPKWASPWWQMLTLHEIGLTKSIPNVAVEKILDAMGTSYLTFFPFKEEDVPQGFDPLMNIPCHCQLGTMDQLLTTYGIELDERLPWLRPWYFKYQIGDGGLNCDEAAYLKAPPRSSVVSTLPPLEAVLLSKQEAGNFTVEEKRFLDNGAEYLIRKRLFRKSNGEPMDKDWLELCFPRFYHYDVLRGLSFLLKWSRTFDRPLPASVIEETVEKVDGDFPDGRIRIQRSAWADANSRYFDAQSNSWTKAKAASFPLLLCVSEVGSHSPQLSKIWHDSKQNLLAIAEKGLLTQ